MIHETARLARIMAECECRLWDIARTMDISIGEAWTVVMPLIRTSKTWRGRALVAISRRTCKNRLTVPTIMSYPQAIVTAGHLRNVVESRRVVTVGGSVE